MKKRNLIISTLVALILFLTFILYDYFEITTLETTYYEITSNRLPDSFNDFKIAHFTDFHNTKIKKLTTKLIEQLKKESPEIIVITGDLIDSEEIEESLKLIQEIKKIAPIYYIPGNHEAQIRKTYNIFEDKLKSDGVIVLRNEMKNIEINNDKINIMGIDDPELFSSSSLLNEDETIFKSTLDKLAENMDAYTILLSHRPEYFNDYINHNIDLTLSGHTHGGQIRIPVIGTIYAPNQGFFPKYDKGIFTKDNKSMIISSGIGTTGLPLRILNKPELVIVKLKANF